MTTIKGKVEHVSLKYSGGIKLKDSDKWLNGAKGKEGLITEALKGKDVEVTTNDKGYVTDINVIEPKQESKESARNPELNRQIIRQTCIKAACSSVQISFDKLTIGHAEALIGLARKFEAYVLEVNNGTKRDAENSKSYEIDEDII